MTLSKNPGSPPLPTNKRLDESKVCAPTPTYGLCKIYVSPLGHYEIEYNDPSYVGKQISVITKTGDHSYETNDNDGHVNRNIAGAYKFAAMNETRTNMGHSDKVTIGGSREIHQQGKHQESGKSGGYSSVSQSTHIISSAESSTHLNAEGHNHHVVNGDQTFHVVDGGMHYEIDKDYTVSVIGGALALHCNKEITINSEKDFGQVVNGNLTQFVNGFANCYFKGAVVVESVDSITFKVGSSSIVINSSSITINSQTVTVNASSGDLQLNASGDVKTQGTTTKIQGGGSHSSPATFS